MGREASSNFFNIAQLINLSFSKNLKILKKLSSSRSIGAKKLFE